MLWEFCMRTVFFAFFAVALPLYALAAPAALEQEPVSPKWVDCAAQATIFSVLVDDLGLDVGLSSDELTQMADLWAEAAVADGEAASNKAVFDSVIEKGGAFIDAFYGGDDAQSRQAMRVATAEFLACRKKAAQ
jgi:hypothetical protein